MSATEQSVQRHANARDIAMARQLREGGWTYPEITRMLSNDGVSVTAGTVRRWCDQQEAERHREYQRQWMAAYRYSPRFRLRSSSPEYQAAFVRRLRAEGEPVSGIVRVCRVVFGGSWSRRRVQGLLGDES